MLPLLQANGRPGEEGLRIDQAVRRALQGGRSAHWQARGRGPRLPYRPPLRTEIVDELGQLDMLPAIVFIFSRAACDDAVRQVMREGVRLTDKGERAAIREIAERRVEPLGDEDLRRPRLRRVARGARTRPRRAPRRAGAGLPRDGGGVLRGGAPQGRLRHRDTVAGHQHASPFGGHRALHQVRRRRPGDAHVGEYLQLTGRAGRRGLDEEGHAVVSWSNEPPSPTWRGSPSAPPPDLRSAFRPTYNLAVNLVARFDRETAHAVLRRSFAQWQARTPDSLTLPARPPARRAGEAGLRRGLVADLGGAPTLTHLPRVRPADRRSAPQRDPG